MIMHEGWPWKKKPTSDGVKFPTISECLVSCSLDPCATTPIAGIRWKLKQETYSNTSEMLEAAAPSWGHGIFTRPSYGFIYSTSKASSNALLCSNNLNLPHCFVSDFFYLPFVNIFFLWSNHGCHLHPLIDECDNLANKTWFDFVLACKQPFFWLLQGAQLTFSTAFKD